MAKALWQSLQTMTELARRNSETQEIILSLGFSDVECCFSIDHYALYCAR